MNKTEIFRAKIEETVLKMNTEIKDFLTENPNLIFYSFAFDCSYEYSAILLCLNTEEECEKMWLSYKNGDSPEYSEEDYFSLRYNTGDWLYQDISKNGGYTLFTEEELTEFYNYDNDDELELCVEEVKKCTFEIFLKVLKMDAYKMIPKTDNFSPLCIDHEDDPVEALENTKQILKENNML